MNDFPPQELNTFVEHVPLATVKPDDPNAKIVEEFQYLLEKSQQLFAGLRDLPSTGSQKTWQPYFQRAFEVYTKLWKFQQIHRQVLESRDYYGLKRWEIGEVASKIGQLYYHYYLRTSETNYLKESMIFYEAIRDRAYFRDVLDAKNPALMIKKMRYYARFIVVCLLLNREELIRRLLEELTVMVDDYVRVFKANDAAEWQSLVRELSAFLEAERSMFPVDYDSRELRVAIRLSSDVGKTNELVGGDEQQFRLQEAILVGNFPNQAKFSELTLDMFRMLQSLERVPVIEKAGDKSAKRVNPRKYLLFRPSISQILLYASSAFKELSNDTGMLIYVSARGIQELEDKEGENSMNFAYHGSMLAVSKKSFAEDSLPDSVECLHAGDVMPFTRKPLMVIIDSNCNQSFKSFPQVFNQPVICLLSPTEYPESLDAQPGNGNLFTMFLHAPLLAFASLCLVKQTSEDIWRDAMAKLADIERTIQWLFQVSPGLDKSYKKFVQDEFTFRFLVRYVFCSSVLQLHINFADSKYLPSCYPPLPPALFTSTELITEIKGLVVLTNTAKHFRLQDEPSELRSVSTM